MVCLFRRSSTIIGAKLHIATWQHNFLRTTNCSKRSTEHIFSLCWWYVVSRVCLLDEPFIDIVRETRRICAHDYDTIVDTFSVHTHNVSTLYLFLFNFNVAKFRLKFGWDFTLYRWLFVRFLTHETQLLSCLQHFPWRRELSHDAILFFWGAIAIRSAIIKMSIQIFRLYVWTWHLNEVKIEKSRRRMKAKLQNVT